MNSDLIELLAGFNRNKVRYLIIGCYAVGFHAEPRYTKDCDIWVATDQQNAAAVHKTLKEFGAALLGATAKDFEDKDAFFKFGAPPNRIDILLSPPGSDFDDAWTARVTDDVAGVPVHYVSRKHLIALKKAAGREIDRRDIKALKESDPARAAKKKKKRAGRKKAARKK